MFRRFINDDVLSALPIDTLAERGYRIAQGLNIPNVSLGVFSLENVAFQFGFDMPAANEPVTMGFGFGSRANPFHVGTGPFGGGASFEVGFCADGIQHLEASIEFGGHFGLDLGVAHGGVMASAGIYFRLQPQAIPQSIHLEGFFRMGGELSVLDLISVSVEFNVLLGYDAPTNTVGGEASLVVKVEVLFFSDSVTLRVRKEFGGASDQQAALRPVRLASVGDNTPALPAATARKPPRIADMLSEQDCLQYSAAFA